MLRHVACDGEGESSERDGPSERRSGSLAFSKVVDLWDTTSAGVDGGEGEMQVAHEIVGVLQPHRQSQQ